jgi:hypothetical protein
MQLSNFTEHYRTIAIETDGDVEVAAKVFQHIKALIDERVARSVAQKEVTTHHNYFVCGYPELAEQFYIPPSAAAAAAPAAPAKKK